MKFTVYELPKATADKRHIFGWIFGRSPRGAASWLDAYDNMVARLRMAADTLPMALENHELDLEARQVLFKTKRGRIYRAVFHIDGNDVYVLRIRGPGQAPILPGELLR